MNGRKHKERLSVNLQGLDGWAPLPSNHFHNLKVIGVKLGVCGTLILGIKLAGSKWTAILCLNMNNQQRALHRATRKKKQ